jgi:pimeloyl-ACP methyl ester carboxylesterase
MVTLVAAAARGEDHFFDSDGVRIRYTDEGQGPPVVLIHGFTANGDMNWRFPGVLVALAKNYRVITLDNRGHGKSDKPTEAADYGAKMADDVIRLLDQLKIEKAHFVGYSMGGMITLKLAAIAPQRMASAVVGGMGWTPLGDAVEEREGGGSGVPALRACARSFPQLGITREQLLAIKTPMIVVIGTEDGLLARRVNPLREARPDIPVVEVAGANHVSCIFNPEFRQAIQEFLDKQPRPIR